MKNIQSTIWDDRNFRIRVKSTLIRCSKTLEADARYLKEGCLKSDGTMDASDQQQYDLEMLQVEEINFLLEKIGLTV